MCFTYHSSQCLTAGGRLLFHVCQITDWFLFRWCFQYEFNITSYRNFPSSFYKAVLCSAVTQFLTNFLDICLWLFSPFCFCWIAFAVPTKKGCWAYSRNNFYGIKWWILDTALYPSLVPLSPSPTSSLIAWISNYLFILTGIHFILSGNIRYFSKIMPQNPRLLSVLCGFLKVPTNVVYRLYLVPALHRALW